MQTKKWTIGGAVAFALMLLVSAILLVPVLFTFLYSFFPKSEITAYMAMRNNYDVTQVLPLLFSPKQVTLRQYYTMLIEDPQYLQLFINSVLYTGGILIGQAIVIPALAYALSRFTFRGRDLLFFCILMLMVLPFQVTMTPNVITLRMLGLMHTPWAIILPMWFSPFYIFLLRQFMVGIPNEIFEAGMIDGAGSFRGFLHVMLPVCRPILGAAVALSFADCWNMVEQPLVYLADQSKMPLSVMFNQINESGTDIAFAGAALYIMPTLLVYFFFQEDIVLGVQLSELK